MIAENKTPIISARPFLVYRAFLLFRADVFRRLWFLANHRDHLVYQCIYTYLIEWNVCLQEERLHILVVSSLLLIYLSHSEIIVVCTLVKQTLYLFNYTDIFLMLHFTAILYWWGRSSETFPYQPSTERKFQC